MTNEWMNPYKMNASETAVEKVNAEASDRRGTYYGKPTLLLFNVNNADRYFIVNNFSVSYKILETTSEKQGFEIVQSNNPVIVIGCLSAINTKGLLFFNRLRLNRSTYHAPLIMIVAKLTEKIQLLGLKYGVDAFITTPLNKYIIEARLHNLILTRAQIKENVLNNFFNSDNKPIVNTDEKLLENIVYHIRENIANSAFDVNQLSMDIGISRMHLYRKIKCLLNVTPNELLKKIRIKRAIQLIEDTDLRIIEIMDETGFESRSAFVFNFRKLTGTTPTDYARNKRVTLKKELAELLEDDDL